MTYEFTIKKICALPVAVQTRGPTKRVLEQGVCTAIVVSSLIGNLIQNLGLPDAKQARLEAQIEPKDSQSVHSATSSSASSLDLLEESLLCGICQVCVCVCVCVCCICELWVGVCVGGCLSYGCVVCVYRACPYNNIILYHFTVVGHHA